jgi:hypothetical protein
MRFVVIPASRVDFFVKLLWDLGAGSVGGAGCVGVPHAGGLVRRLCRAAPQGRRPAAWDHASGGDDGSGWQENLAAVAPIGALFRSTGALLRWLLSPASWPAARSKPRGSGDLVIVSRVSRLRLACLRHDGHAPGATPALAGCPRQNIDRKSHMWRSPAFDQVWLPPSMSS